MSLSCDFCGYECSRHVEWIGKQQIICCYKCAENALPMMIADSLPISADSIYHAADKEWNGRFKVRFLRALLSRCQPKDKA